MEGVLEPETGAGTDKEEPREELVYELCEL